jgi:hypothetical protein
MLTCKYCHIFKGFGAYVYGLSLYGSWGSNTSLPHLEITREAIAPSFLRFQHFCLLESSYQGTQATGRKTLLRLQVRLMWILSQPILQV